LRPITLIACLPFVVAALDAAAITLEERLDAMAARPDTVLRFEEVRQSDLLDEPVIVRGRLEYEAETGRLTKWVDEPRPGRLTVTPTHLEAQSGNGRTRRLPLERRPEFAALLGGVRALLAGDAAALEDAFHGAYSELPGGSWELSLTPRSETVRQRMERIDITGADDQVRTIETVLADGRRERMTIVPSARDEGAD
jgi:hypothetical protein